MLHLTLLAVGKLKDEHLSALCEDFRRRLRRYARIRVETIKDGRGASPEAIMAEEAERIAAKRGSGFGLVALDRQGRTMGSEELSRWLSERASAGQSRWAFAIGGPWGLAPKLLSEADLILSLSAMTFPHDLARLLTLEQLYRAMTIWRGEPYHK